MIPSIEKDLTDRMQKCVEALKVALAKIRTGRATPSLLDSIMVEYYGQPTPLNQVASVNVGDARTLLVTPWEKGMLKAIEKAIVTSDLGLNPVTFGEAVRVPMPALTEARRRELGRVVKTEAEKSRVAIRNLRRDGNTQIKSLLKEKSISEDDERRAQDRIQKITDGFITDIDGLAATKEADLMAI